LNFELFLDSPTASHLTPNTLRLTIYSLSLSALNLF
jgi:hypothetical protein